MFDTLGKKGGRHTGTFFGFFIAARLPKHHLSTESKEAVEATWGIIATISALVLSLLLSTAKSSFDTVNTEVTQSATKIIIGHKVVKLKPVHGFAARDLRRRRSPVGEACLSPDLWRAIQTATSRKWMR